MKKHKPCVLPFSQLYLHSSGRVYPCGFLQNNILLGDSNNETLENIWNGERLKSFQEEHEKGENIHCLNNQQTYNCHLLHDNLATDYGHDPTLGRELRRLDFMVDSKCNLKCIMCTNIYEENGGFQEESFWKELEEKILPNLWEIEIIGGEPFISKDTFRLIDLAAKVNPEIQWWLTTNGHIDVDKALISKLEKIKVNHLALSIDSLQEDLFSQIRQGGGELSKVLKALDLFIEARNKRDKQNPQTIMVNCVVSQLNAKEVPDFVSFCERKEVKFYPILLIHPEENSLLKLSDDELNDLFEFYLNKNQKMKNPTFFSFQMKLFKQLSPVGKVRFIDAINELKKLIFIKEN